MIIVFACNITSLCVNILYRFVFNDASYCSVAKTVFQAAGAHGIKDDGIVAKW
jgi:hypothetical protein